MGLKHKENPPRDFHEDLTTVKASFTRPAGDDPEVVSLKDHRAVSSYNLIDDTTPAILVPGSAPIWKASEFPITPPKAEKGAATKPNYTDPNAHHNPSAPLAALVQAVKVQEPNFEFNKLNLVADRVNLRRLLAWASSAPDAKDFRIDVELLGKNTVALTRWEAVAEASKAAIEKGFKEEALGDATSFDAVEEGEVGSHFRIVSFDFLGTKALVRFPVDCCTSDSRSRSLSTSTAGTLSPQSDNAPLPAMQDITSGLTVHTAGNLVPQSAIVELSLISKTAKFDRIAAYDQMLFSQTPSMYLARHSKGSFGSYEDIKLKEMRVEEKKAQPALHKLSLVLKEIEEKMKAMGAGSKASLVSKEGKLELYERTGGVGLPQGLADYFV